MVFYGGLMPSLGVFDSRVNCVVCSVPRPSNAPPKGLLQTSIKGRQLSIVGMDTFDR